MPSDPSAFPTSYPFEMWVFWYFTSVVASVSLGASPSDFIKPCRLADNVCVKASTQLALPNFMLGLPELGVEVLDPLQLPLVQFDLAGLQFKMENATVKGWKNAVVDTIKWNEDNKILEIEYHSDYTLKGDYVAGGQLFILPISGNGDFKVKIKGLYVKMNIPFELLTKEDGKRHFFFKKYDFTFDAHDGVQYSLTNLFQGNKQLGAALHNFLNQNWKAVTQEFGGPILEAGIHEVFRNVQVFFDKVPVDELILL